jgi:hypothetical protein
MIMTPSSPPLERRAKIVAAEGEFLAAVKLGEAADVISQHPVALQLRTLQTMAEINVEEFDHHLPGSIHDHGPGSHQDDPQGRGDVIAVRASSEFLVTELLVTMPGARGRRVRRRIERSVKQWRGQSRRPRPLQGRQRVPSAGHSEWASLL